MKTKKNLTINHEVTAAGTVTAYDGWRECVNLTIRDDNKDGGQDEVCIELPNNVFDSLVEKLNEIVVERNEAAQAKLEESEVE